MSDTSKVDVLAVMDDAAHALFNSQHRNERNALILARDAVAEMIRTLDDIGGLSIARRVGGPDPMDLNELDAALGMAIDMSHEVLSRIGENP